MLHMRVAAKANSRSDVKRTQRAAAATTNRSVPVSMLHMRVAAKANSRSDVKRTQRAAAATTNRSMPVSMLHMRVAAKANSRSDVKRTQRAAAATTNRRVFVAPITRLSDCLSKHWFARGLPTLFPTAKWPSFRRRPESSPPFFLILVRTGSQPPLGRQDFEFNRVT